MFVEVLLAHESVPADRDAMIRGVNDVGVFQLPHLLEFPKDQPDLIVDVLDAGVLPAKFVAHRGLSP